MQEQGNRMTGTRPQGDAAAQESTCEGRRPRQMTVAAGLLAAAFLPRIADYLLGCFASGAEVDPTNAAGGIAVGLGIRALLMGSLLLAVLRGRSPRFWTLVWLEICVLDLFARCHDDIFLDPWRALLLVISMILQMATVWVLFRPACDEWLEVKAWRLLSRIDRGWPGIVTGAVKAAIPAVLLFGGISVVLPHVSQTPGPISRQSARHCPIPLPDKASDIQCLRYHHAQAYRECVRFQAPVQDCIAHAKRLIPVEPEAFRLPEAGDSSLEARMQRMDWFPVSLDLPRWFDVGRVTNGLRIDRPTPLGPRIWIDLDRGVFYYMVTD